MKAFGLLVYKRGILV